MMGNVFLVTLKRALQDMGEGPSQICLHIARNFQDFAAYD